MFRKFIAYLSVYCLISRHKPCCKIAFIVYIILPAPGKIKSNSFLKTKTGITNVGAYPVFWRIEACYKSCRNILDIIGCCVSADCKISGKCIVEAYAKTISLYIAFYICGNRIGCRLESGLLSVSVYCRRICKNTFIAIYRLCNQYACNKIFIDTIISIHVN